MGPVLKSRGGVGRRGEERFIGLTSVEVAVASAGGAFQGGGVSGVGCRGGHEFAAAIEGVAAEGGGVVLEAFLVSDDDGVVEVERGVALEDTVGERRSFSGLDPGGSLSFSVRGFDCRIG